MHTLSLSSNVILALFLKFEIVNPLASFAYLAKHITFIESIILPSSKLIKYLSFPSFARFFDCILVNISPLKIAIISSLYMWCHRTKGDITGGSEEQVKEVPYSEWSCHQNYIA